MYEEGLGVEKNDGEAFGWYLKAAEQGDVEAQRKLASMYEDGLGVEKDSAMALFWLQKSRLQTGF